MMNDQYFGVKELNHVVLRAKHPMEFGSRRLEADEPVLYFEKVNMSILTERSNPIMARGGWSNLPHVIWEDRSEVRFTLSEGVMSSISMGILLSAKVAEKHKSDPFLVQEREIVQVPLDSENEPIIELKHWPSLRKKVFIFEYSNGVAQRKIYGKILNEASVQNGRPRIYLYNTKDFKPENAADVTKQYLIDYYYEYDQEALIYTVQKERFNGLFSLEGKFYSKDENEGVNYTNIIYMPKVRVVSDINLRLGERADPTMSVFNIIGLPETVGQGKEGLIFQITRLSQGEDEDDDF